MWKVSLEEDYCKGCWLCKWVCPKNVFEEGTVGKTIIQAENQCIGCQQCVIHCPDFALKVEAKE